MNPSPTSAPHHTSALVLFSGGQDSATCLAWALARYPRVETLGFDYGQRHSVELQARLVVLRELRERFPAWSELLGEDHMLDLAVLGKVSETSLTRDMAFRMEESGLPNTFVPGRNLLFLTLAAALAYRRGIQVIVTGVCETDFSGYPDCRDDTMKALQVALSLGMDHRFLIDTPLMWIDKAETWRMAEALRLLADPKSSAATIAERLGYQTEAAFRRAFKKIHGYGPGRARRAARSAQIGAVPSEVAAKA